MKALLCISLITIGLLGSIPAGAVWSNDPAENNPICAEGQIQLSPAIVGDGENGAIIVWDDWRGSSGIYAQRIDAAGNLRWDPAGVLICDEIPNTGYPEIINDAAGGTYITWMDDRANPGTHSIYAQRLDGDGNTLWAEDGIPICVMPTSMYGNQMALDPTGALIIAWNDERDDLLRVYAQKISPAGIPLWTPTGVMVCGVSDHELMPCVLATQTGGAVIAWNDHRGGSQDLYAQRLTAGGTPYWSPQGVPICMAPGTQSHARIVTDNCNGAVIAWRDGRAGNNDIYAQLINYGGVSLWPLNGIPVCEETGTQDDMQLVSDTAGGAIAVWRDRRTGDDIFAQRISNGGVPQWTINGIAICNEVSIQIEPAITPDGSGGAIISWRDGRNMDTDLYAQKVNSSGVLQWAEDGVVVCNAPEPQSGPRLVDDETGGTIITWYDYRGDDPKVYAQRVDGDGTLGPPFAAAPDDPASSPGLLLCGPNPFVLETTISFTLAHTEEIALGIYSAAGRRVTILSQGVFLAGPHQIRWDGRNARGDALPGGAYFARLRGGQCDREVRIVLIR